MRFVIHAGVHKTGTSTLQHFLSDNAAVLLTLGSYYPVGFFRPWTRQHSALAPALRRDDADLVRSFFDHCLEFGVAHGAHTTIVSGEELGALHPSRLHRLRDAILATDPRARIDIVLYYRNLYDLAISLMQQTAKTNRWLFDGPQDKRMIAQLDPTQQIERFEQVFGAAHVQVGIFDIAIRAGGLDRDFLRRAGLEWSDQLVPTDSRNASMDLISTTFLNMLGYEYTLNRNLWRNYSSVAPESFVFPTLRNHLIDELHDTVASIDLSHPKLAAAAAVLTEPRRLEPGDRSDLADFLRSFEAFVRELRVATAEQSEPDEAH